MQRVISYLFSAEIVEALQAALSQFAGIAADLEH